MDAPQQHSFIDTKLGKVHYRLQGPSDGPFVVCCHGLGDYSYAWSPFDSELAGRGYHVLTFDLFGRGFSDCADGDQDADYFVRQIEALLEALGMSGRKFGLIGHSMGGAISLNYSHAHPDDVEWLILVAPAGLMPMTFIRIVRCCFSGLRDMMLAKQMTAEGSRKMCASALYKGELRPDLVDSMTHHHYYQIEHNPHFRRALANTIVHFPFGGAESQAVIKAVGQHKRPVLFVWGKEDPMVPFKCHATFASLFPTSKLVSMDQCGHSPMHEHRDKFNDAVFKFVDEHWPVTAAPAAPAQPVDAKEVVIEKPAPTDAKEEEPLVKPVPEETADIPQSETN